MEHEFTDRIRGVLNDHFGKDADEILSRSDLIQYLNYKTRSASRGSKARGSFGNIYAIYVLVEDYLNHDFDLNDAYSDYDGAQFSDLLQRQRELPFGSKLQNHALNHRLNQEFQRQFPQQDLLPIIRDRETSRYWINERLVHVEVNDMEFNICRAIIDIIDAYIESKQGAFKSFISAEELIDAIQKKAEELYPVRAVVEKYMTSIEEVISIPQLLSILRDHSVTGRIISVIDEILVHSRVEFNFSIRD